MNTKEEHNLDVLKIAMNILDGKKMNFTFNDGEENQIIVGQKLVDYVKVVIEDYGKLINDTNFAMSVMKGQLDEYEEQIKELELENLTLKSIVEDE